MLKINRCQNFLWVRSSKLSKRNLFRSQYSLFSAKAAKSGFHVALADYILFCENPIAYLGSCRYNTFVKALYKVGVYHA